jgi:type II secretory pathway pseudopilin PulG
MNPRMDIPMRIIVALSIIGVGLLIGIPVLVIAAKRRRRDKLRRRGIKDYNRSSKGAVRN